MPFKEKVRILKDADTPTHTWQAHTEPMVFVELVDDLVEKGIAERIVTDAHEDRDASGELSGLQTNIADDKQRSSRKKVAGSAK